MPEVPGKHLNHICKCLQSQKLKQTQIALTFFEQLQSIPIPACNFSRVVLCTFFIFQGDEGSRTTRGEIARRNEVMRKERESFEVQDAHLDLEREHFITTVPLGLKDLGVWKGGEFTIANAFPSFDFIHFHVEFSIYPCSHSWISLFASLCVSADVFPYLSLSFCSSEFISPYFNPQGSELRSSTLWTTKFPVVPWRSSAVNPRCVAVRSITIPKIPMSYHGSSPKLAV